MVIVFLSAAGLDVGLPSREGIEREGEQRKDDKGVKGRRTRLRGERGKDYQFTSDLSSV